MCFLLPVASSICCCRPAHTQGSTHIPELQIAMVNPSGAGDNGIKSYAVPAGQAAPQLFSDSPCTVPVGSSPTPSDACPCTLTGYSGYTESGALYYNY